MEREYPVADGSSTASRANLLDGAAVSMSLLCLVHCLALPMLALALPAFGLALGEHRLVHALLLGLALPLGLFALGQGRKHAGPVPLLIGCIGFALMAVAIIWFHDTPWEARLTVIGVVVVALAHGANWRARHAKKGFRSGHG